MTSKVIYLGELRTESVHTASGNVVTSDAPVDNHGKGEAFSPTDAVANALATCMFTIMGIKAQQHNIDIRGSYAEVTKFMKEEPRMIRRIDINIFISAVLDDKTQEILERVALTCPVYLSLHPDMEKNVQFHWK